MDGLLVVDKPGGISSHDVVRQVRRLCRQRQVGHAGTLDPMATGILLVGVGAGTRILQFLTDGRKTYRATLKLGQSTDTQDAEGQILAERSWHQLTTTAVEEVCASFVGEIRQLPPMFSALKKDGVPLYRLARQGLEVERQTREITIFRLQLEKIDLPFVTLLVDCSKGTYIRTLCHDIGEALGCGAHMTALRRTRSGSFGEADSVRLDDYAERPDALSLLSLTQGLRDYPVLRVDAEAGHRLGNGVPPALADICDDALPAAGSLVQLHTADGLLAMARFEPERRQEKRGDFQLIRVFPGSDGAR
ncbi:MAG: tRNA pseudouridine(55) synthase TruB [Desulfuromonadaceae bacterium]